MMQGLEKNTITAVGPDGKVETFRWDQVLLINMGLRARDVCAVEEVTRILNCLSKDEARRVLAFASAAVETRPDPQ